MLSKHDRFAKWRRVKTLEEKNFIDTVPLVENYIKSFRRLEALKLDAQKGDKSPEFKALDQFKQRTMGAVLYIKLSLDEAIDTLQESTKPEKLLLTELRDIVGKCYIEPKKLKIQEVNNLIAKTKQLLSMDVKDFSDPKLARKLCVDLYGMLNIAKNFINNLDHSFAGPGIKLVASGMGINIEAKKKDIDLILTMAETKTKELDRYIRDSSPVEEKTVQDHINKRILTILGSDKPEMEKLATAKSSLTGISTDLTRIIELRKKKDENTKNIEKIEKLLEAIEINATRITKRHYFLDFINSNKEAFDILMHMATDPLHPLNPLKKQLENNIERLKNPSFSSNALYVMSWPSTVLVAIPARTLQKGIDFVTNRLPQRAKDIVGNAQDTVESYFRTVDSERKADLKYLAEEQLKLSTREQHDIDQELDALSTKIADESPALKELIDEESSENLQQIVTANTAAVGALDSYVSTAAEVNKQRAQLMKLQESNAQLSVFLKQYDGILVSISYWFSKKWPSLFKSDTAEMIVQARALQKQIDLQATHCEATTKAVQSKMLGMLTTPNLATQVKDKLKEECAIAEEAQKVRSTPTPLTKATLFSFIETSSQLVKKDGENELPAQSVQIQ